MGARCGRYAVLLALSPLLGGCAAAVVAPILATGGIIGRAVSTPEPDRPVAAEGAGAAEVSVQLTGLTSLPEPGAPTASPAPPTGSASAAAWTPFVDYALARARGLALGELTASALLVADPPLDWPDRRPCASPTPAVLLDLDAGAEPLAPSGTPLPAPGLVAALERLRQAGVVVMWISRADANRVTEIGEALRASGLDPAGRDPLLLVRSNDRKQSMRLDANRSACVLAVAGTERADFDELFDYLREPAAAAGLEAMLGDGWFLTPAPLAPGPG